MADKKYPFEKNASWLNGNLKQMVSFGDSKQSPPTQDSVTGRLKDLVKKVEDLNRRMDRIKDRY